MFALFPLLGFFLLGLALQRFVVTADSLAQHINRFIIWISFPAIILLNVPKLVFTEQVFIPALSAWVGALLAIIVVPVVGKKVGWNKEIIGAVLILTTMGNTAFFGVPVTQLFFGDEASAYAIIYDQFGSFLFLSTLGLVLIANYSPRAKSTLGVAQIVKKIFSFPPFLALLVALFLPIEHVLISISTGLKLLSQLLMPLALIVIGLQFRPKLLPHHRVPLIVAISMKMFLLPLIVFLLLLIVQPDSAALKATMIQAATPGMITPGLLAIAAGIAPRLIATVLGYGALISFLTLPVLAYLMGGL